MSTQDLFIYLFGGLLGRLLGDRSPFTQQSWQGDNMDRDEETARIQRNYLLPPWITFLSFLILQCACLVVTEFSDYWYTCYCY